jgi:hypothetical protein
VGLRVFGHQLAVVLVPGDLGDSLLVRQLWMDRTFRFRERFDFFHRDVANAVALGDRRRRVAIGRVGVGVLADESGDRLLRRLALALLADGGFENLLVGVVAGHV